MNFIDKYFNNEIELGIDDIIDGENMLIPGVFYDNISHYFLNGVINYIKPIKAFLIDYYRTKENNGEYRITLTVLVNPI